MTQEEAEQLAKSEPTHSASERRGRRQKKKITKSRNAAETLFGWQFQISAAIYLMLETFSENKFLKVEGKREDIEITKKNGDKYYAQAKSMTKPFSPRSPEKVSTYNSQVYNHLWNAICGLEHTYQDMSSEEKVKCKDLVYISNIEYPFGNCGSPAWEKFGRYKCSELREAERESLQDRCGELADGVEQLFSVVSLRYENIADWRTAHKDIIDLVRSFLKKLQIDADFCDDYLKIIQELCYWNGTNKHVEMTNEDFVWPAIARCLEFRDAEFDTLFDDMDIEAYEVSGKYKAIIDSASFRLAYSLSILEAYRAFRTDVTSKIIRLKLFMNECALQVCQDLLVTVPDEDKEPLAKYIVYKIVKARSYFSNALDILK